MTEDEIDVAYLAVARLWRQLLQAGSHTGPEEAGE